MAELEGHKPIIDEEKESKKKNKSSRKDELQLTENRKYRSQSGGSLFLKKPNKGKEDLDPHSDDDTPNPSSSPVIKVGGLLVRSNRSQRVFRNFAKMMGIKEDTKDLRYESEEKSGTSNSEENMIDVQNLTDLPKEIQKMVKLAKIDKEHLEEHLDILLNIIHFQTKVKFKSVEEKKKINLPTHEIPPPQTPNRRPQNDEDSLINKSNPKDYYKIQKEEGKGGFGAVFKAIRTKDAGKVAIKIMPHVSEKEKKFNITEIGFLKYCQHQNIVSYYDSFLIDNSIWCVMEYLEGGTLDQAVKAFNFSEKQIAYVAREILNGIKYLHSENLVHRDLKSANVMMSIKGEIKIIDFGLCVDISDGMKTSMVGSPFWMPPEMIQRKPHDSKVDIWSLGICLMELANGHPPHHKSSLKAMYSVGVEGIPQPLEKLKLWSDQFRDFLSLCLQSDPQKRASATQLLQHPFLEKADNAKSMQHIISGIFMLSTVLPF